MIGKRPIRILETSILFTNNKLDQAHAIIGPGKVRMLNYAERYIIFQMRIGIKVYDTIENTLKSCRVSNRRIEKYMKGEVEGSCCVVGT